MSPKENILKKIRKALSASTPLPFPMSEGSSQVFQPPPEDLEMLFAEAFTRLQGKFVFCLDTGELSSRLVQLFRQNEWTRIYCSEPGLQKLLQLDSAPLMPEFALKDADLSITTCECLVARTGSIVVSAAQQDGRTASVYAPIHICIAFAGQMVYDIKDAIQLLKDKYGENLPSLISFASGPSRTADIEKTLVVGVHGPREVYVFLVDQPLPVESGRE